MICRSKLDRSTVSPGAWLPWPDLGAFVPPRLDGDVPTRGQAAAASGDDGRIWFAPVGGDAGRALHHLVGNVAEFVFDDAAAADSVAATPEAATNQIRPAQSGRCLSRC